MGPDERPNVEVGQRVAVQAHEGFGEQGLHVSDRAPGTEGLRLHRIPERHAERIPVTEGGLDPPGERGEAENDVRDPRPAEKFELGYEERPGKERDDRLGTAEREGAQP